MKGENNPHFGVKNTIETRQKISEVMKTDKNFMKNSHHYVNYDTRQNIVLHDYDDIPDGFVKGMCLDFDKHEDKLKMESENKKRKEELYTQRKLEVQEMFMVYNTFGFDEV